MSTTATISPRLIIRRKIAVEGRDTSRYPILQDLVSLPHYTTLTHEVYPCQDGRDGRPTFANSGGEDCK